MINNITIGQIGEAKAYYYLKNKDYKILETNYKNKMGEIDIIVEKNGYTIFVEVKNRTTYKFGLPREAVTLTKQRKIKQVATLYLLKNNKLDSNIRFDVIEINGENIVHIENAF